MKRTLFIVHYSLFIIALLAACADKKAQSSAKATIHSYVWTAQELPCLNVGTADQGVAGAILNIVGGRLTIWGGANFPDRPAAEGGAKRVWDCVYTLDGNSWQQQPVKGSIAYAATCSVPLSGGGCGVAVLGGNSGNTQLDQAQLWADNGLCTALPDIHAVDNAAAAYGDGYIYLVGGQTPNGPSAKACRLRYPGAGTWQPFPDLPGSPRVQCSAAWLDGRLYVAGGYNPTDGTVNGTLISWTPGDSTWTFVNSLRKPDELQTWTLVGGTMLADTLQHCLLFIGGVDATIFQEAISRPMRIQAAKDEHNTQYLETLEQEAASYMHHEPDWYRFNDKFISYDIASQQYTELLSHPSLARAGAAVLMQADTVYVINGELKPGIRSNTALRLVRTACQ